MRAWVVVAWAVAAWASVVVLALPDPEAEPNPDPDPKANPDPDPDPARERRQLSAISHMLRQMQHSVTSLGRRVVPGVQYAAERLANDVAPSLGQALVKTSNNIAMRAAEGLQATAQVVSTKIMPAIEDRLVEASNAAIPYINQGIDALGTGLQRSANMVSRGTAAGLDRLGFRVLGQKRHNRVKTITRNIHSGISSGLSSLASAITSLSSSDTGVGSVGEAVGRVVSNTAYALSSRLLGQNLTQAVAPIAKSVSQAVGQSVPAVSFGDGRIVIDLPGTETERTEPTPRSCTTPAGHPGLCQDLSDCPDLILDLTNLRKSVCFKSLFVPGVCCPGTSPAVPPTSPIRPVTAPTPVTAPAPPQPQPPPHQQPQCGVPQVPTFRVVGGEEARRGQWPWMAAVWLHGNKKTEFWCGASLVSPHYVLTAAHCTKDSRGKTFSPRQFSVRLGDHNIFSDSDDFISHPQTLRVSEIKPHPEFRAHGFYNDVALLKLATPATLTQYVVPVCLPDPAIAAQPLDALVGQTPSVVGWGSTFYGGHENPTLREAQLPIWRNSDCDDAYFQPITEIFLCAGFVEGGRDACQGDSGGPLLLYVRGRWVQIGLVSFGNRCAEPGYPGVYTRITHFLPWILRNMV